MQVHFVKSARKDNPFAGIKKGDSYYWWQFAFSSKSFSKKPPKPQQLTRSDFLISVYDIQDRISGMQPETFEDFNNERDEIVNDIQELATEQEEKRDNMPETLQDSATGELLQERHDSMDEWASEIESVELEEDDEEEIRREIRDDCDEKITDDELDERVKERIAEIIQNAVEELQGKEPNL